MDKEYNLIITLIPDSFSCTIRLIKGGMMMANDNIINIEIKPMKNARSSDLYSGYGISCVWPLYKTTDNPEDDANFDNPSIQCLKRIPSVDTEDVWVSRSSLKLFQPL